MNELTISLQLALLGMGGTFLVLAIFYCIMRVMSKVMNRSRD